MTVIPRNCFVRRSLAGWLFVTSVFLALPQPLVAAEAARTRTSINSDDGESYLRRQVEQARFLADVGAPAERDGAVDRILSMVAALENPDAAPVVVATALSEVMGILVDSGQPERAWGLYRASGDAIGRALPEGSLDAVAYRVTEARILEQVGDVKRAAVALDGGLAALRRIPGDPPRRNDLLADMLSRRAAIAAVLGDFDGAREALAAHPDAALYRDVRRAPASAREISYLATRALVAALGGGSDAVAARALSAPPAFRPDARTAASLAVHRTAAAALAQPPGAARQAGLIDLGRRLRQAGGEPTWRRPDAIDQVLIALALTQVGAAKDAASADIAFGLFQLAGRAGPSFDADALTALGQAKTEMARRTIHQVLRLRARRDRLVREQVQAVMTRASAGVASSGRLRHDVESRWLIRDFDVRIRKAEASLAASGVRLGGSDLTSLARLQATLADDEAVLAMAPTAGGYAYMCVRRGATLQSIGAVDPLRLRLDTRLVQSALTATHAPNERLDMQFPVEASVRLYEALIRPFEPCLKAGDRIVWMSGLAGAPLPLSALLPNAPAKIAGGYDLASADWLVRRHAVSYAGSAGAIVAARTGRTQVADFDFLGVGDPVLRAKPDEDPARRLRRGPRLDALAPLPETRDELEASARGFRSSRVLLQDAATERGLRGEMVGAYRYLSFATHGLMREDLQGLPEPALVLTPVDAGDPIDDGLLTASEIADMNLRAAFVALSACNTANYDLTQLAQDLPALASAFAVAGVPSTLATLWPVNSEASKQVVAGVFASLRDTPSAGSATALAEAQRRFLTAPPGRAYLHPRFWAPFVILGDGGPVRRGEDAAGPALRSVDVLTTGGGEVLGLRRTSAGTAARFISDADTRGRQGSAVRVVDGAGVQAWRRDDRETGAGPLMVQLGPRLVVGGYRVGAAGRNAPTLQAYEDGVLAKAWLGDGVARVDAFVLAGLAMEPDRALIAVGELNLRDPPAMGGGRLHILEFGPDLAPRPVFDVIAPPGFVLASATMASLGSELLVTYTTTTARAAAASSQAVDDYDTADCPAEQVTWLELRDPRTGALRQAREVRGLSIVAALARPDGKVWLGGAVRTGCGEERRATVVAVDSRLATRAVYTDASLGASDVRTLGSLPNGRVFVAASKENVVTYRPPAPPARANPFVVMPFVHTYSGLLLTLGRDGVASPPKLLDSGSNIYVTATDAGRPDDILLGGALAGQAAIFHLSEGDRPQ